VSESSELLDIARMVAGWGNDGEQVEAFVARGRSTSVKAYRGEVESFTSAESSGAGIRVIVDHRQGLAYAGSLDDTILKETLEEARDNAAFGQPDEHFGLAHPDGVAPAVVDNWRQEVLDLATDEKIALAKELERAVVGRDPRVKGVRTASYSDGAGERAIATTAGIEAWGRSTSSSLSVSALAEEGGETKIAGGFSIGRGPSELSIDEAAAEAVLHATRLLGAIQPTSRKVTIILEPMVTASLLGIIGSTLSGIAVARGRSLFADRVGELVAADGVTLVDDPLHPDSIGGSPEDGEGLASRRNALIDAGRLQGFVNDTYSGRLLGTGSTASAVRGYASTPVAGCRALTLTPGSRRQAELIASIDNGLLVQSVSGLHSGVNPVSGDFSVGAEGLIIRNGALAEPAREMTIASTLQRMLLDVLEVGADVRWVGSGSGVSLVIGDVAVGGA
jgi:PmbA protein